MASSALRVSRLVDLVGAVGNAGVRRIVVEGEITGAPSLRLAAGQQLVGSGAGALVVFADGVDGVQLSRDNELSRISLRVTSGHRAVCNDTSVEDLGTIRLAGVTAVGQVQILARDRVRGGHVVVDGLDVVGADVRDRPDRPHLLGVSVLQGAFTLWNLQDDDEVVLTAELRGISAGRADAPVRGSGVFVGGADGSRGRLEVSVLETGPVFTNGGIPAGTRDRISGGVFVIHGAHVGAVHNHGQVTTSGVNDMALDNWGSVDRWTADAPLTTYGSSGVGFVNFGTLTSLRIRAPVETHGRGARGFNVYVGASIQTAEFDRVTTHGDAAIGIQVSQPLGRLVVRNGIHTHGGTGEALVRGEITRQSAHALSVLAGGSIDEVAITGPVASHGADLSTVDVQGQITGMRVAGGIHAHGSGSDALHVNGGTLGLHHTNVTAADGAAIRLTGATLTGLCHVTASGAHGDVVVDQDSILVTDTTAHPGASAGNRFRISGPGALHTGAAHPRQRERSDGSQGRRRG